MPLPAIRARLSRPQSSHCTVKSFGTHKQLQQQYSVHKVTHHKYQNSKVSDVSINAPHNFAMAHINQTLAHLKQHKFQSSH